VPPRLRRLANPPAFFLRTEPGASSPRLDPADLEHARRVLRLRAGDPLVGLDGLGHRWPLRIRSVAKGELELEASGPMETIPAPGREGCTHPWIEVAVSWPRRNRVEDMVARLVQLGAAAILPLVAEMRGPEDVPEETPERLQRVARESCKQCGRAWMPRFEAARTPAALAAARKHGLLALLDPHGGLPFDTWLRSFQPAPLGVGTEERPIVIVVGPEGGFSAQERNALLDVAATPVWLGPHVLRVETAAEAAMAVAVAVHALRPSARQ